VKNSLDPGYDYNGNLVRLIDGVDSSNNLNNLSYDGVGRLQSADGKWGTGRYDYDELGNVLSRSLNNSTIHYHYNALNRLNNLTGAYAYGYQYDARGPIWVDQYSPSIKISRLFGRRNPSRTQRDFLGCLQ